MHFIKEYESIFLLSEKQQSFVTDLQYYETLFFMLRHDYLQDVTMHAVAYDLTIYFYEEDSVLIDNSSAMIHLLRNYIVDLVKTHDEFERIKRNVVRSQIKSIFAAVLTVNIFIDYMREIITSLDEESIIIWTKLSSNPHDLFNVSWESVEQYPKKYVYIQTNIIQSLKKKIALDKDVFHNRIQNIVTLITRYELNERDLFSKNKLNIYK